MDRFCEYNQRQERTPSPTRQAASLDQRYRDPHNPRGYGTSHQGWRPLTLDEHCDQSDSTDYTKYLESEHFSYEGTASPQDYSQPQYQGQGQDYHIGEHTYNQSYNAYNDTPQFGQASSEHQPWSGYDYGRTSSQREQEHSQPQDLGYYNPAQEQDYHRAETYGQDYSNQGHGQYYEGQSSGHYHDEYGQYNPAQEQGKEMNAHAKRLLDGATDFKEYREKHMSNEEWLSYTQYNKLGGGDNTANRRYNRLVRRYKVINENKFLSEEAFNIKWDKYKEYSILKRTALNKGIQNDSDKSDYSS